jgi:hypothetical protein
MIIELCFMIYFFSTHGRRSTSSTSVPHLRALFRSIHAPIQCHYVGRGCFWWKTHMSASARADSSSRFIRSLSSVPPSSYPRLQSDRSVHLALYAAGHHHASLHFFLAGLIKRSSSIHVQLLSHHTCILHYRLHHLRFFLVTGANCF